MPISKALLMGLMGAGLILAADPTGKWEALTETPRGEFKMTFDLKADGEKLTGTISNDRMGNSEIQDGKISGEEISFKQVMSRGDREMTIEWTGVVKGDEIELTRRMVGGPGGRGPGGGGGGQRPNPTITAKRVQ